MSTEIEDSSDFCSNADIYPEYEFDKEEIVHKEYEFDKEEIVHKEYEFDKEEIVHKENEFDKEEIVHKGEDETYINENLYDDDELRHFLEQDNICTDEHDDYDFSFLENQLWLQEVLHKEYDNTHTPYCFDSVEELQGKTYISAENGNTHTTSRYDSELPGQISISQGGTARPSSSLLRGASVTSASHKDREYIKEGGTTRPGKRRIFQPGDSELNGAHELEKYMHKGYEQLP